MPEARTKTELSKPEVIFFSPSRCHMISYKAETRYPDGRIKDRPQMIEFDDFEYRTSDPDIIKFIKNCDSFKNNPPKIVIVTQDQLLKLRAARTPEVVDAQTSTKPDYLAMAEANGPIEE
jgi:hypothetical protein